MQQALPSACNVQMLLILQKRSARLTNNSATFPYSAKQDGCHRWWSWCSNQLRFTWKSRLLFFHYLPGVVFFHHKHTVTSLISTEVYLSVVRPHPNNSPLLKERKNKNSSSTYFALVVFETCLVLRVQTQTGKYRKQMKQVLGLEGLKN